MNMLTLVCLVGQMALAGAWIDVEINPNVFNPIHIVIVSAFWNLVFTAIFFATRQRRGGCYLCRAKEYAEPVELEKFTALTDA